jgi:CheY-like chemotaxis protein
MNTPLRPLLIVEDNDMDLDLCLQAFADHGIVHPVHICRDGEEALTFIATHVAPTDPAFPLLVLLDLRLPKVDGLAVLCHARQQAHWAQVPFIVLTTSREKQDISAAYGHGANAYLVKPVDFDAFSELVKHIKAYWLGTTEAPVRAPREA